MGVFDAIQNQLRRPPPRPPVSAVIGVSAFDVPFLAITLPHVVRQARFAFAERVVVIDPAPRPGARKRARGEPAELERILDAAQVAGTIDRVVALDATETAFHAIHTRYFDARSAADFDADRAIYAALSALEAARHDLVAWFHADLLFHADERGWLAPAVDALVRDPNVWLASTHSGPPPDRRQSPSRWLRELARGWLERGRKVPSGHFLCDRRRLHGKLREVTYDGDARQQLSGCIADALEHHQAFAKIVVGSWHLRPRSHVAPWAQWTQRLIAAVERGEVPDVQRDGWIRLDDAVERGGWRRHLFTPAELAAVPPQRMAKVLARRSAPGPAPISVIIPIRNRAGNDVRNALASLAWQRSGRPFETILVSHGSDPAMDDELRTLALAADATLIAVGSPADAWNKPLALNTGILATDPSVPFVMTMDGDMMLADNMLDVLLAELRDDPAKILLCQSSDLPEDCPLPDDAAAIHARFDELRRTATVRGQYGTGGIQVMKRSFLMDIRGYDEDMVWWGALDTDLVRRAEASGLRTVWVTDRTAMLHQWHPRKHRVLDETTEVDAAQTSWLRNHELMIERAKDVVRNHAGWGATITER